MIKVVQLKGITLTIPNISSQTFVGANQDKVISGIVNGLAGAVYIIKNVNISHFFTDCCGSGVPEPANTDQSLNVELALNEKRTYYIEFNGKVSANAGKSSYLKLSELPFSDYRGKYVYAIGKLTLENDNGDIKYSFEKYSLEKYSDDIGYLIDGEQIKLDLEIQQKGTEITQILDFTIRGTNDTETPYLYLQAYAGYPINPSGDEYSVPGYICDGIDGTNAENAIRSPMASFYKLSIVSSNYLDADKMYIDSNGDWHNCTFHVQVSQFNNMEISWSGKEEFRHLSDIMEKDYVVFDKNYYNIPAGEYIRITQRLTPDYIIESNTVHSSEIKIYIDYNFNIYAIVDELNDSIYDFMNSACYRPLLSYYVSDIHGSTYLVGSSTSPWRILDNIKICLGNSQIPKLDKDEYISQIKADEQIINGKVYASQNNNYILYYFVDENGYLIDFKTQYNNAEWNNNQITTQLTTQYGRIVLNTRTGAYTYYLSGQNSWESLKQYDVSGDDLNTGIDRVFDNIRIVAIDYGKTEWLTGSSIVTVQYCYDYGKDYGKDYSKAYFGAIDIANIKIEIMGLNDAPVIVSYDANKVVKEAGVLSGNVMEKGIAFCEGQVKATDPDVQALLKYDYSSLIYGDGKKLDAPIILEGHEYAGVVATAYGKLYYDQSGHWRFEIDNNSPNVNAIPLGEEKHLQFQVEVTDEFYAKVSSIFSVYIYGTNDAPYVALDSRLTGMTGWVHAKDYDRGDILSYSLVEGDKLGLRMMTKVGEVILKDSQTGEFTFHISRYSDLGKAAFDHLQNMGIDTFESPLAWKQFLDRWCAVNGVDLTKLATVRVTDKHGAYCDVSIGTGDLDPFKVVKLDAVYKSDILSWNSFNVTEYDISDSINKYIDTKKIIFRKDVDLPEAPEYSFTYVPNNIKDGDKISVNSGFQTIKTKYGILSIDKHTGKLTFTLDIESQDLKKLTENEIKNLKISDILSDFGQYGVLVSGINFVNGEETLFNLVSGFTDKMFGDGSWCVNITGTNTTPTIIAEDGVHIVNEKESFSGKLNIFDPDSPESSRTFQVLINNTVQQVEKIGTDTIFHTEYGDLTIQRDGTYRFIANGRKSRELDDGEFATVDIVIRVIDQQENPKTAEDDIHVYIVGRNDAPEIGSTTLTVKDDLYKKVATGKLDIIDYEDDVKGLPLKYYLCDSNGNMILDQDGNGDRKLKTIYGDLVVNTDGVWIFTSNGRASKTETVDFYLAAKDSTGLASHGKFTLVVEGQDDSAIITRNTEFYYNYYIDNLESKNPPCQFTFFDPDMPDVAKADSIMGWCDGGTRSVFDKKEGYLTVTGEYGEFKIDADGKVDYKISDECVYKIQHEWKYSTKLIETLTMKVKIDENYSNEYSFDINLISEAYHYPTITYNYIDDLSGIDINQQIKEAIQYACRIDFDSIDTVRHKYSSTIDQRINIRYNNSNVVCGNINDIVDENYKGFYYDIFTTNINGREIKLGTSYYILYDKYYLDYYNQNSYNQILFGFTMDENYKNEFDESSILSINYGGSIWMYGNSLYGYECYPNLKIVDP